MESHRKVLYILKDYLEPTFVLIFNLEAAVKISLIGWNTYRKFSKKKRSKIDQGMDHTVWYFRREKVSFEVQGEKA